MPSVDLEMLCALCYDICPASKKRNSTQLLSCPQQVWNPLQLHDVRCQPPLQPRRSPSHTTPPSLACPFYPGRGKEAHGTAECIWELGLPENEAVMAWATIYNDSLHQSLQLAVGAADQSLAGPSCSLVGLP